MIEIAAVGALLAQALPYLLKSADTVATQAAEKLGATTWDYAQRVWAKLGGPLNESPTAQVAIDKLASGNAAFGALLEHELGELLTADPALAGEVEALMREAKRAGARIEVAGDRNVVVADASLTNSPIIAGDGNTLRRD